MDGTFQDARRWRRCGRGSLLSAFSRHSVLPEWSCIKIDREIRPGGQAIVGAPSRPVGDPG